MVYLMKCGHTANAEMVINGKKVPCCAIHNCIEIEKELPDLKGRKARCPHCGEIEDSDWELPFFHYNENGDEDTFYDGCWGWD